MTLRSRFWCKEKTRGAYRPTHAPTDSKATCRRQQISLSAVVVLWRWWWWWSGGSGGVLLTACQSSTTKLTTEAPPEVCAWQYLRNIAEEAIEKICHQNWPIYSRLLHLTKLMSASSRHSCDLWVHFLMATGCSARHGVLLNICDVHVYRCARACNLLLIELFRVCFLLGRIRPWRQVMWTWCKIPLMLHTLSGHNPFKRSAENGFLLMKLIHQRTTDGQRIVYGSKNDSDSEHSGNWFSMS